MSFITFNELYDFNYPERLDTSHLILMLKNYYRIKWDWVLQLRPSLVAEPDLLPSCSRMTTRKRHSGGVSSLQKSLVC